ncbi:MAG: hypothetical protein L0241_32700 [Planctomycetia bacterium]|nr:hypothetical protein [Planctomycetia bacterium]
MPVRSAIESSGQFLRKAAPQLHESPSAPTARDYSTATIAGSVTVILVAALHHVARIDLSPEVVAALTTIMGFLLARFFRY